jgi:membrane-associated phospholipid phosphatase
VRESAHVVGIRISEFIAANGRAETAIASVTLAAAVFAIGYLYRSSGWRAAVLRTAGLLTAVGVLTVQVRSDGWLTDIDHAATAWLVAHRSPPISHLAVAVTNAVDQPGITILTAVCAAGVGWRFRSLLHGVIVIATVGCAALLCSAIKFLVTRPGPPATIHDGYDAPYSFMSVNVTTAATLLGITAVGIALAQRRAVRGAAATVVVLATAVVALSRVYLGVHWLTDVAAAALLAAAVVTVGAAIMRALTYDASVPIPTEGLGRPGDDVLLETQDRTGPGAAA